MLPNGNQKNRLVVNAASVRSIKAVTKSVDAANPKSTASNAFTRTSTLPRRFKEKFMGKHNTSTLSNCVSPKNVGLSNLAPSIYSNISVNSQSSSISNSSSCSSSSSGSTKYCQHQIPENKVSKLKLVHTEHMLSVGKFVDKFLKSLKYLEQIIVKKKYEIIASAITAILEAVLDIYTVIQSFDLANTATNKFNMRYSHLIMSSSSFKSCRTRTNTSLANLIKWSDAILFLNAPNNACNASSSSSSELFNETHLIESAQALMSQLNKSIRQLVKYLKKFFHSQQLWTEQHMDVDLDKFDASLLGTDRPIASGMCLDLSSASSTSSLNEEETCVGRLPAGQSDKLGSHLSSLFNLSDISSVRSSVKEAEPTLVGVSPLLTPVETTTVKTVDDNNCVKITHTTVKSTSKTCYFIPRIPRIIATK